MKSENLKKLFDFLEQLPGLCKEVKQELEVGRKRYISLV